MNPLPLTDPTGRVLAYVCGRCLCPGASASPLSQPSDLLAWGARQAGDSLADAERCCSCSRCGIALDAERYGECPACAPILRAEGRLILIRTLTRPRLRRALAAIARFRGYP